MSEEGPNPEDSQNEGLEYMDDLEAVGRMVYRAPEETAEKEAVVKALEEYCPEVGELHRLLDLVRGWIAQEPLCPDANTAYNRGVAVYGLHLLNAQAESVGRFSDEQKTAWRETLAEDILFIKNLLPEDML